MPTRGRPRHRVPPGNTGAGRPGRRRPRRPERRAARPRRAGCGRSPTRDGPGRPPAPRPAWSAERRASRASAATIRPRAPRRCRAAPAPVASPDRGPGSPAPNSPIPARPPRQPSRRRTGRAGGAAAGPSLRASCRGNYGGRRWVLSVFSVWFRSRAGKNRCHPPRHRSIPRYLTPTTAGLLSSKQPVRPQILGSRVYCGPGDSVVRRSCDRAYLPRRAYEAGKDRFESAVAGRTTQAIVRPRRDHARGSSSAAWQSARGAQGSAGRPLQHPSERPIPDHLQIRRGSCVGGSL